MNEIAIYFIGMGISYLIIRLFRNTFYALTSKDKHLKNQVLLVLVIIWPIGLLVPLVVLIVWLSDIILGFTAFVFNKLSEILFGDYPVKKD